MATNRTQKTIINQIQRRVALIFGVVIFASLVVQSLILGTVGTQGPEISEIRDQQKQIRLENEILLAQIREQQTSTSVLGSIETALEMQPADLNRIEIPAQEVVADSP